MIGEMKLEKFDLSNDKHYAKLLLFGITIFIGLVVGFLIIWHHAIVASRPSARQLLRERCEDRDGVLIEGVNEQGEAINNFAICVPYEALTCIDVE